MPLQGLDEKESKFGDVVDHAPWRQLAFLEQVHLLTAQSVEPQRVRRLPEVLCELGHRPKVMTDRIIGVVSTLEFLSITLRKRVTGISFPVTQPYSSSESVDPTVADTRSVRR
jgi:hypothetical protein